MEENLAYSHAVAIQKLKDTRTIACIDIDGTFAIEKLGSNHWPQEREARKKLRAYFEPRSVLGSITMRTPGMMISESMFKNLHTQGYQELPPKLGRTKDHRRFYAPSESLEEFKEMLDWDFVAGIGSGIIVKQHDEFVLDTNYEKVISVSKNWREKILELLRSIDTTGEIQKALAPIEYQENYIQGITDIAPLPFRVQLNFNGEHGLLLKLSLIEHIRILQETENQHQSAAQEIAFLDESKPQQGKYTLYLLPQCAKKEYMLDYVLKNMSKAAHIKTQDIKLIYAGDTMTDLRAGLRAGFDTNATFILAGGSCLTSYLVGEKKGSNYAGESLTWVYEHLEKTSQGGIYIFSELDKKPRKMIIADEAVPGTVGPGSLLARLEAGLLTP